MSSRRFFSLLSLTFFVGFVYFSYLVSKETFVQFDFDTTVKIQNHIPRKVDFPFSILSLVGSAEVTGVVWLGLVLFAAIRRYWFTVFSLTTFILATAIELFGKLFILHPGPPFLFYRGRLDFSFPSSYAHTDYSYPSGHLTRISFLVTFLLVIIYFKVSPFKGFVPGIILFIFLGLMVISRIYLGEHWTTDVIGGLLLGSSLGILTGITIPSKLGKAEDQLGKL